jgi:ribosomal-protein-alanine acetyltransferase
MHGIRRFEVADAAAVCELAATEPYAAQWSVESYRRSRESGFACWVAMPGDSGAKGFIVTRTISGEAEILNLAVAADCRRRGLASALFDEALKSFQVAGVRRIFLEVRASNLAAIAFYRRHGFAEVGLRVGYYPATESAGSEDAVLMQKFVTGRNQVPT